MVWPRRPMTTPRSSPIKVPVISSSVSLTSTVASRASASTTRSRIARTRSAGSAGRAGETGLTGPSLFALRRSTPAFLLARGRGWLLHHRPLLWRRLGRRGDELLYDRLLAHRPEVRRDPVDDETGWEVDDEGDEDDRQREHHDPLRSLGRGGHDRGRPDHRRHVEDQQDDQGR